jgi:hypothetical protein
MLLLQPQQSLPMIAAAAAAEVEVAVAAGTKMVLFVRVCIQTIILPRQARDKHRESTQKE